MSERIVTCPRCGAPVILTVASHRVVYLDPAPSPMGSFAPIAGGGFVALGPHAVLPPVALDLWSEHRC